MAEADWAQLCEVSRDRLIGKPRLPLHDPALEKSVEDLVTKLKAIEYDPLEDKDVRTPIIVDEVDTEEVLTVGGERVALAALAELGFADLLEEMGLSERYVKIACALVAGRMLSPGSELHTHEWMHTESAILELLELGPCSESTLYRVGDALWEHHEVIMDRLFDTTRSLFGLEETIIFYDLTNTYTYGGDSPLRKHGHSKEKRSDCRLVTLALTLDASGFPRRAEVLPGNASEPGTLKAAIEALNSTEPTVIMDAGLATAANLEYLGRQRPALPDRYAHQDPARTRACAGSPDADRRGCRGQRMVAGQERHLAPGLRAERSPEACLRYAAQQAASRLRKGPATPA